MTKDKARALLLEEGVIAIIRADAGGDRLLETAGAIADGGIRCIEVTMNTPGAIDCIAAAAVRFRDRGVLFGAGTVLDAASCRDAISAGAQFIVTPVVSQAVIAVAAEKGVPVCCGALTPTEIYAAWQAGTDMVKVFPAGAAGGPDYIRAIRGPLGTIPLVAVGGVRKENAAEYFRAGAAAVAVGGQLARKDRIDAGDFESIRNESRAFMDAVRKARAAD
jgi:2-dehydro-3-deoxyphosphogluconate aldolase / (4S)-4-hydroxy-2-oxoglutarate aldolase